MDSPKSNDQKLAGTNKKPKDDIGVAFWAGMSLSPATSIPQFLVPAIFGSRHITLGGLVPGCLIFLKKDPYKVGQKDYKPSRFVILSKKHKEVPHAINIIIKEYGQYKKEKILSKKNKTSYDINLENKEEYKKGDYTYLPENHETRVISKFFGTKLKYIENGEYIVTHREHEYSPYNL